MPMPPPPDEQRYDPTTVKLHWLTAVLIALLWLGAHAIDWFPKGEPRWNIRTVHMALGVVLAGVLVVRIGWRTTRGARLDAGSTGAVEWLTRALHVGLYALMIGAVVMGFVNAWVRGEHISTWYTLTSFAPDDKALRHDIGEWHETLANAIMVLAMGHAAAALYHHHVLKDGVLRRMLRR